MLFVVYLIMIYSNISRDLCLKNSKSTENIFCYYYTHIFFNFIVALNWILQHIGRVFLMTKFLKQVLCLRNYFTKDFLISNTFK